MSKIIIPVLIAAALPAFAQTTSVEKEDASTTITTTVTTDPVVAPATTPTGDPSAKATPAMEKTVEGIVSEINQGAEHVSVIVPDSSIPMTFVFNDQTEMVDLQAETITWPNVKLGQAVTVTYIESADNLVAKNLSFGDPAKLVPVPTATAVMVATPAPVVEETTSTTTTTTTESE